LPFDDKGVLDGNQKFSITQKGTRGGHEMSIRTRGGKEKGKIRLGKKTMRKRRKY
jgi:hypothetical protein